ncbi:efflux RND transporter permease subunit [Lentisalinibacter salinarum]|uniref:efflux RND transporter permease subunit n=1 Tax=Lentisalinibacter salinarum TaxID=2992239 RepID=UPI0038706230
MEGRHVPPVARPALALFANRHLLVLGVIVILLAGLSAIGSMPRIEDPRITNRNPKVITLLPGATAARMEALITDPVEDALREIAEIAELDSNSRAGVSVVNIQLQDRVGPGENERIFSRIRDRLNDVAAELPPGARLDFDDEFSATAFSLVASISWEQGGEPRLTLMNRLAEELADRLRNVPGTELVRLYGQPAEEITVTLDRDRLAALGMTAAEAATRVAGADPKQPAGALRTGQRQLFVEVAGELDSVARVASIPLLGNRTGALVTVGDVADVTRGWQEPPAEIARTGGARSILVAARTGPEIRVDRWAEAARAAVEEYGASVGQGIGVEVAFDQSRYTEERLSTLGGNLFAGALLVMLVVFVGMGWRAALIVGAALPLSAALTVFGLNVLGQQIHQMTIFGMIIAIGLLIDNAIVMTDEVKKKLDRDEERTEAVRHALSHLFVPLLASTLTTILGFMPVFLLPGPMGDFVGPIAIAVVLALTASFLVATTFIPVLAGINLRRRRQEQRYHWWDAGFRSRRLAARYRRLLTAAVARPWVTAGACLVLPVSGFVLAGTLGQQFFPPADRDHFEIEVWLPPDAAIVRTADLAARIEAAVRREPGVERVDWRVGGSYPTIYYNRVMRQDGNAAYAHAMVYTDTLGSAKRLTRELPRTLSDRFPEAAIIVSPFAQGPPVAAPVGFRITGADVATLKRLGGEVRRIMHTVPGILQTRASVTGGEPKLAFRADEYAARLAGLSLSDVAGQMQANLEGATGGTVLEDLEELPVRVRLSRQAQETTAAIAGFSLLAPALDGEWIPADAVGEITLVPEAASISRRDGRRVNNIYGYIRRDALAIDVTNAVRERMAAAGFTLPPGYTLTVAGDSEEQSEAFGELLAYMPVLLLLMAATIILSFRSVTLAALIGVVAVLSVGLGMLSLWAGGYARGFNAIIGSAGLIGVAINGTIVVLAGIRANPRAHSGAADAIVEETVGATRHIASTTLTTVGGFVPLLVFTGGDFWPPLAIVIAGGVFFSITLSLGFTPAVYRLLHRRRWRRAEAAAAAGGSVPA